VRILVVDDNRDSADALAWLLQSIGHEARTAYDGLSALVAVERHSPEVVIQDLGMPDMSGYEIARRMRQLSAARHALLVAVTGGRRADALCIAKEAGFDRLLLKPVGLEALEEALVLCST
jgi:CheY-like chemotaxis protein